MSRGFLMFACGSPLYGTNAYNLAMSLKAFGQVEVAVLFNGRGMSYLGQDQLDVFDHIIHIDEAIAPNTMCKLHSTKYTPFDKTVVLDADMLWLPFKNPNELLDELENISFTGITEGREDYLPDPKYFFWADVTEIKANYQLQSMLHQWRSEFIYYDKQGTKIIERALEIVNTHKLASVKNFAHHTPDELGINIAAAEAGVVPHKFKWIPAFWPMQHGNRVPALSSLKDEYWLMSFGSNVSNNTIKGVYDIIMSNACNHFGKQHVFRLVDKKHNIPERNLM